MKKVKKMLNTKLERYMIEPHALPHEVSVFIYIDNYFYFFKKKKY